MAKKKNLWMSKANWKSWLIHTGITVGTTALWWLAVAFQSPEFKDLLVNQFGDQTWTLVFSVVWLIIVSTFVKKFTDKK